MIATSNSTHSSKGFGILDSIVALTITGCLLGTLVPLFVFGDGVGEGHARRDAQEMCSICYEAKRAGVNFVVESGVQATVQNLLRGGQSSTGRAFKATGMTAAEASAASRFLRVEGDTLVISLASGS